MTTAHEALRQCVEAMKEVDFIDVGADDRRWHKLNAAQQVAEEVLKRPAIADIHCQEFHELAMEYRSTNLHAEASYQRLCDYIDARIAAASIGRNIPDGYQLVRLEQLAYKTLRGAVYGGSSGGYVPLYRITDELVGE